jgi:hypothetical protein
METFGIRLVAADFSPQEVRIVRDPERVSGIAPIVSLPDWEIVETSVEPEDYEIVEGSESTPGIVISFTAHRMVGYYIFKIIVPLILIVAMSWIVFWIDPRQGGSQIGVSVTTMLTLIAYRFSVGILLPKVSYLTRMDVFILGSTILVFSALIVVVATSFLARTERLDPALAVERVSRFAFPLAFLALCAGTFGI